MKVKIMRSVLVGIALVGVCLVVVFITASSEATVGNGDSAGVGDAGMAKYYCCCTEPPHCRQTLTGNCSGVCPSGPYTDCSRCMDSRTCAD
jgi:hypothetical protein